MKKTKILSLLLCLSLFCALIVPCTKAYAESDPDNGMKISKTATANKDGSYTITLEAYATGSKVISEVKEDVPTDIVLVLDQSGSMADDIGTVSFEQYKDEPHWVGGTTYHTRNQDYYKYRHNGGSGNLWHKLEDGSYVSVSVKKSPEYTPLPESFVNYETSWGRISKNCYFYYANNLYEKVGDEYKKVELSENKSGDWYNPTYTYTYTFSDGTSISSTGRDSKPNLGSHAPLYTPAADGDSTVYTYTYTDSNENVQTIGTSTGAETVFSPTLYERVTSTSGGGTRLNALKNAVTNFTEEVAKKAAGKDGNINTTKDNINHRIAMVGFASSGDKFNTKKYENTEVFVGANQYTYGTSARSQYGNALQSMDTAAGQNNITSSIGALGAYGGTFTNLGMEMANGIFENNPITDKQKRNRVIIVFTDGYPGTGDKVSSTVADPAVSQGYTAKQSTANGGYGATVYTVGIFSGADGTPVESLSSVSDPNKFMHLLSSNYKNAQSYSNSSKYGTATYPAGGGSYYLSAGDSASLNNIFQQISNQIETGGAETTLGSETVVKDIISPYFTLPEGATDANITLETYACTGKDAKGGYTWSKNADAMGAKASISGDQVNVTGFNFSENYVGTVTENGNTTYRGNKLVISFKVQPKPGFLGGNDVITNTSAGIYENDSAQTPVMTFDQPKVNVPIKKVTVTAQDKNVYLKGEVTADQLKDGSEISVGNVKLDLSKATDTDKPYGLEKWQTEYVNIAVEVKDKNGNVISDKLDNLTDDTTYTVEVTVAPTTEATSTDEKGDAATAKTGFNDPAANIYVFKPELTYKDSEVYYGDNVPTDYSGNLVSTKWFHTQTVGGQEVKTEDRNVTMVGAPDVQAPVLSVEYTPDANKIKDGRIINTKDDIPVAATVKIGPENINEHTTFVHQNCSSACDWNETDLDGNPAFLLHVKTCTLTITKKGGDSNEPYVFDICKDGVKYSEVTIVGNDTQTLYELPVGNYTIVENEGWSWRYTPSYSSSNAVLNADKPNGSITCTNTKTKDQWLNGFSDVKKNIFGVNHNN